MEDNVKTFVEETVNRAKTEGIDCFIIANGYTGGTGSLESVLGFHPEEESGKQILSAYYGRMLYMDIHKGYYFDDVLNKDKSQTIRLKDKLTFYDFSIYLNRLAGSVTPLFYRIGDKVWSFQEYKDYPDTWLIKYFDVNDEKHVFNVVGMFQFYISAGYLRCRLIGCDDHGQPITQSNVSTFIKDIPEFIHIDDNSVEFPENHIWQQAFNDHWNGSEIRQAVYGILSLEGLGK